MTDMTRHQRPTGPAIFSRGLLVSLLQVSKPIAVSTTDDWEDTGRALKAMGERSKE